MEIVLRDSATGTEHVVELPLEGTLWDLRTVAGEAFGYDPYGTELRLGGVLLGEGCAEGDSVASSGQVEVGEVVDVAISSGRYAEQLRRGMQELVAMPGWVRADAECVLAALEKDSLQLAHADPALKGDREVVAAAVERNGLALQYADRMLQGDSSLVLAAVRNSHPALRFAAPELMMERSFALAVVGLDGTLLQHFPRPILGDRVVVAAAVRQNRGALVHADLSLLADADFLASTRAATALGPSNMSAELRDSWKGRFEFVLVRNVTNMPQLIDRLRKGEVDAGVVNPRLVLSPAHLQVAAQVAINNADRSKLITNNVNSEYVFALSPSRTISQAYCTFGPTASGHEVLFGAYYPEPSLSNLKALEAYVLTFVSGDIVPIEEVSQLSDVSAIRALYKVPDAELGVGSLEDAVIGRIATSQL